MRAAACCSRVTGLLFAMLASRPAAAADPAPPTAQAPPAATEAAAAEAPVAPATPQAHTKRFARLQRASLIHDGQFGIALLPGSGFRGIFPYQENVPCGNDTTKRVCTGRLPLFLDVQPSFGFATHWDVLVDLRFGIEQDFTQTRQFAVAPGVRYWIDPELGVKFFATIQVAYDTTAQHDPVIKNNDFAFRNADGLMFEVMRNFGIYLQVGDTIGFVRWLRFEIDGGVGVQARFP
jgi:hypothetical protein